MADDDLGLTGRAPDADLAPVIDRVTQRTDALARSADRFAGAMLKAFATSAAQGRQFDSVLKGLGLSFGRLALRLVLPGLAGGVQHGFGHLFGAGAVQPFARGGVIGRPSYFPLPHGRIGLAGEAGAEAILPLARGPDGRLGVAANGGGGAAQVTVNIVTPDAASFRQSEAHLAGQIARAVARGQRVL